MSKAWLDCAQNQTVFGVWDTNRFYSKEYTGDQAEAVAEFAAKVREFNRWCRVAYQALNAGQEPPPPPLFVARPEDIPAEAISTDGPFADIPVIGGDDGEAEETTPPEAQQDS